MVDDKNDENQISVLCSSVFSDNLTEDQLENLRKPSKASFADPSIFEPDSSEVNYHEAMLEQTESDSEPS